MAVAAAGLMYTFAFNLQTKTQEGVERTTTELLEKQQEQVQTRLSIDSVYKDSVTSNIAVVIRNVGSKTIVDGTAIGLYIDGAKYDIASGTCDNLAPEDTCTVTTSTGFPAAGEKAVIHVVAPSGVATTYTCYSDGDRC
jgi:archaellum component FlaF (FlaF/FlaG flagellin family)